MRTARNVLRALPVFVLISGFGPTRSAASTAGPDYQEAAKLARLPAPLNFDQAGHLKIAAGDWTSEKDKDGTDMLTAKKADARAAVLHTTDGKPEALISYLLATKKKEAADRPESSTALFFKDGQIASLTTCEDSGEKDAIGRTCVTATSKLCTTLRTGAGLDAPTLNEMDAFEMRALASILTLRGSDHQLDNVLRSGNRLGLKSSLQTTKGQLLALAKQLARELGRPVPAPPLTGDPVADARINERAKADDLIARSVLEKSLPRLKQSCAEAKF